MLVSGKGASIRPVASAVEFQAAAMWLASRAGHE
jgi:hypothetical protein